MYSLIVTLALLGQAPGVDKDEFRMGGHVPPVPLVVRADYIRPAAKATPDAILGEIRDDLDSIEMRLTKIEAMERRLSALERKFEAARPSPVQVTAPSAVRRVATPAPTAVRVEVPQAVPIQYYSAPPSYGQVMQSYGAYQSFGATTCVNGSCSTGRR